LSNTDEEEAENGSLSLFLLTNWTLLMLFYCFAAQTFLNTLESQICAFAIA